MSATLTVDEMNDIQRDLGRLEGTVEAQGAKLDVQGEKIDRILAFQEQQKGAMRLGMLAATVLGAVAGFVGSWFKP